MRDSGRPRPQRRARSGSRPPGGGLRTIGSYVEPYDPQSARRVGAAIISLFAVSLFVGTLAVPIPDNLTVTVAYICPAILLASAVLLLKVNAFVTPAMCAFSLVGVVLIVALNLVTRDASPGAQVSFCAPVMFAASQLRPAGAMLTLVASVVGEAVVVLQLKPFSAAMIDLVYVGATLIALGLLLILAARRQNRLLRQLKQQAAMDPLTGLVTRRVLDDAVRRALRGAPDGPGTAMVLIDIDHFKSVNDTYGHPVGDDALAQIAGTLRSLVRPEAVVSRLGGDEIAVLLPDCSLAVAAAGAQAFVDAVRRRPLTIPGRAPLQLSISAGIGYAARNGLGLRQLYAAADASLYEAKNGGRGRVGRANLGFTQGGGTDEEGAGAVPGAAPDLPSQHPTAGHHRAHR